MTIIRYDSLKPVRMKRTPEGYLRGEAVVTRSGIFKYQRGDGSINNELRPPDEVFSADSMETLKLVPMTVEHPREGNRLVTADNAKELSVGSVGESIRRDGEQIIASCCITDAATVKKIEGGEKVELSCGYTCDIESVRGDFNGERYDSVQKNIRYNHLAIVDSARAGSAARLRLDSGDAQLLETGNMKKVRIDGIEYEAAPEVINALDKANAELTAAKTKLDGATAAAQTAEAKADSATAEHKKLKDGMPASIAAAVTERVTILDAARAVIGDEAKDDMDNGALMKAVILKRQPETKLDGKSDEYIRARFDAVIEVAADDAMAAQRGAGAGDKSGKNTVKGDSASARERMVARMKGESPDKK